MLIKDLFNVQPQEGDIGIELEVEAEKRLPSPPYPWVSHAEGSLRGNAIEYVTGVPLKNGPDKFYIIETLTNLLKPCNVRENSPRTSTHVHINVQRFEVYQVYAAICLYWLVENLLMKFCSEGTSREGNHFCLRIKDAESLVLDVCKLARAKKHFHFGNPNLRYSALNLSAIVKFGSLEFRGMRGTTDPWLIHNWSSELFNMCHNVKKFLPDQLMDFYYGCEDKSVFLSSFFDPVFIAKLKKYKHWQDLIEENVGYSCDLAYLLDWRKVSKEEVPEPKKKKGVLKIGVPEEALDHPFDPFVVMDEFDELPQIDPGPVDLNPEVILRFDPPPMVQDAPLNADDLERAWVAMQNAQIARRERRNP